MQRVISRVHQIVTSSAGGDGDGTGEGGSQHSNSSGGGGPNNDRGGPGRPPNAPGSTKPAVPNVAAPHGNTRANPAVASAVTAAAAATTSGGGDAAATTPAAPQATKDIALAVERLQYATLLGERKKAITGIQTLAERFVQQAETGSDRDGDDGLDLDGLVSPRPHQQQQQQRRRRRTSPEHVALGRAAVPAVLGALRSDPRDTELMEAMLECLHDLVTVSPSIADALLTPPPPMPTTTTMAPMIPRAVGMPVGHGSGIQLALELLQDPSPWIRGPTIALIRALQEAAPRAFAAGVLACKEGLRRLLEVVQDKREHIRDTALQLLVRLTDREKDVQQFLAFEDGFARLFAIMDMEGLRDGSSVVADCLQIVNNMLRDNLMNQTLFRESPFLTTHVPALLALPPPAAAVPMGDGDDDGGVRPAMSKAAQRKRTIKLALQLVRFLVAGLYEGTPESQLDELAQRERKRKETELPKIQSSIGRQEKLLGAIAEIVCVGQEDVTDLRLQALDLLQLVGTGHGGNQIILVHLVALPSNLSLLSELMRLDLMDDETPVGAAATNLLDHFFAKNEPAKMAIFQHLNAPPPPTDDDASGPPPVPAGRVLLDAIAVNADAILSAKFSEATSRRTSTILVWKASHRFAALLEGSAYCKELALRIPSKYSDVGSQAVSGDRFLSRVLRMATAQAPADQHHSAAIFQMRVALFTLLIKWCFECANAARELVGSVSNLAMLVDSLKQAQATESDTKMRPSTPMKADERLQIQGLTALLVGCCLEFMVESPTEPSATGPSVPPVNANSSQITVTRSQLLDMIAKRVGLESFTNALIQLQQSSTFVVCAQASRRQSSRVLAPQRVHVHEDDTTGNEDCDGYLFTLYEKTFTTLAREMTDQIQKRVISIYTGVDDHTHMENSVGAPSAVSAYQDLIRAQDKQIQDLQAELAALQSRHIPHCQTSHDPSSEHLALLKNHKAELVALRAQHAEEKLQLEEQLATLSAQTSTLEARFQGLSKAFNELELEHAGCTAQRQHALVAESSDLMLDSVPTDAMAKVVAELERETLERRRISEELVSAQQAANAGEQALVQQRHEADIAKLRAQQELEAIRVSLAEKEETILENQVTIETLEAGQASAKRTIERLRADLSVHHNIDKQISLEADSPQKCSTTETHELTLHDSVSRPDGTDRSHVNNGSCPNCLDGLHKDATTKELYQLYEKEKSKVRELKDEIEPMTRQSESTPPPILSVEQCGHAPDCLSNDSTQEPNAMELESLRKEISSLTSELINVRSGMERERMDREEHFKCETSRLNEVVMKQLQELNELRALVDQMEAVSMETTLANNSKDTEISMLKEQVVALDIAIKDQKRKSKATISELEDEVARMFLDKKEQHRKAKSSMKELENEIARMFFEKVEFEKTIVQLQSQIAGGDAEQISPSRLVRGLENSTASAESDRLLPPDDASLGSITTPTEQMNQNSDQNHRTDDQDPTIEDLYILLASLDIQCNAFRDSLAQAKGEDAVVAAVELSRRRGALAI